MKIEEIFELWEEDVKIDRSALDYEACKIPSLHHKYLKLRSRHNLLAKKMKAELDALRLEKYEFYTQGSTAETDAKGWKLPSIGRIKDKNLIDQYMTADADIIDATFKYESVLEAIKVLTEIVSAINNRSFQLNVAVNYLKWSQGA